MRSQSVCGVIRSMAFLVTGAAGFVALNVVEHLLRAGHEVVGLDRIPLPARAARDFAALAGRLTMVSGSILSDADLFPGLYCGADPGGHSLRSDHRRTGA